MATQKDLQPLVPPLDLHESLWPECREDSDAHVVGASKPIVSQLNDHGVIERCVNLTPAAVACRIGASHTDDESLCAVRARQLEVHGRDCGLSRLPFSDS